MKYAEARSKIKSGDLLAWTHKKWGSFYDLQVQAVRTFTQSEYCHVGLAWVFGGRVFIIESVGAGVRIMPLSHELPCYWLNTDTDWTPEAEEFVLAKIGEPYSKLRAIRDFLGWKNSYEGKHEWTCAELVLDAFTFLKFPLNCPATPSEVVQAALMAGKSLNLIEA